MHLHHTDPLPRILLALANAAGQALDVAGETPNGQSLAYHATAPATTLALQRTKWDRVVVQEQSEIPSFSETQRSRDMYPPGLKLVNAIRERGAEPWLYSTYAHAHGDARNARQDSYEAMQARLDEGYRVLAGLTQARVLPVGAAFRAARTELPNVALWQPDGVHAAAAGELLAACVLFAGLVQIDPTGLAVDADLDSTTARQLRLIAARTVRVELGLLLDLARH